ncbi:hypothetical protein D3C84_762200 [compost metagenome]
MGNRRQQGTAQLLGFAMQARRFQVFGQTGPGQRLGQGLAERGQQAPTLGRQRLALTGAYTQQRQGPLLNRQRPPPPATHRQCIRAMARRLIVLPSPVGSRPFNLGELLRSTTGNLPTALAFALEQAQLQVLPALQVLVRGIHYRLAIGRGSQLARQVEQFAGFFLGIAQGLQLPALTRGQVAGKRRHHQEKQQRQNVFFTLDTEREIRRYEQKVIDHERQRRTGQRRPQATAHSDQQYRGEKHQ